MPAESKAHCLAGGRRATIHPMIKDEEGASMVEYGLIVALIALVALVAIELLGSNLSALFNSVAGTV